MLDTSPKMRLLYEEMLRRKTGEESLKMAEELTLAVQMMAFSTIRERHPELTDDEIWFKLAEERLGPELAAKALMRE